VEELSAHLEIGVDMIRRWDLDAEGAHVHSLDQPLSSENASATLAEMMADDRVSGLDDLLTREQEVTRLKAAIATLREQERTVLALNFFEELKLQEIGQVLGLSICRISQIRTAALAKLRAALSELRAA
jgi:RNA polymerase sigma factor for flagellar operon FliA